MPWHPCPLTQPSSSNITSLPHPSWCRRCSLAPAFTSFCAPLLRPPSHAFWGASLPIHPRTVASNLDPSSRPWCGAYALGRFRLRHAALKGDLTPRARPPLFMGHRGPWAAVVHGHAWCIFRMHSSRPDPMTSPMAAMGTTDAPATAQRHLPAFAPCPSAPQGPPRAWPASAAGSPTSPSSPLKPSSPKSSRPLRNRPGTSYTRGRARLAQTA